LRIWFTFGGAICQRPGLIVVELETRGDQRKPEHAFGFDILDAVGGGDGPFNGAGDESAHDVGARTNVDWDNNNRRILAARVLPNAERTPRLQPGDNHQQIDHDRENRAAHK
jgi:hypothetical protein